MTTSRNLDDEQAPVAFTTRFDGRFSEPNSSPTPWHETESAIASAELFWITTVRADGRPHVTPLVAVWHDGALHFCTGPDEQKARNLEHNQSVVLATGRNEWDRGVDVVVEGEAARVTEPERLRRLADAWTTKWDGQWQFEVTDGGFRHEAGAALVFAVRPSKVLAFGKGVATQTTYVPVDPANGNPSQQRGG